MKQIGSAPEVGLYGRLVCAAELSRARAQHALTLICNLIITNKDFEKRLLNQKLHQAYMHHDTAG
jgi:hypothetical protein